MFLFTDQRNTNFIYTSKSFFLRRYRQKIKNLDLEKIPVKSFFEVSKPIKFGDRIASDSHGPSTPQGPGFIPNGIVQEVSQERNLIRKAIERSPF